MASPVNPPRGMRDFLPAEKAQRERILSVIRASYRAHGFDEIETPVVEDSERLHAGLGGDNEKLAYAVLKPGLTTEDLAAAVHPLELENMRSMGEAFKRKMVLSFSLWDDYGSHMQWLDGG